MVTDNNSNKHNNNKSSYNSNKDNNNKTITTTTTRAVTTATTITRTTTTTTISQKSAIEPVDDVLSPSTPAPAYTIPRSRSLPPCPLSMLCERPQVILRICRLVNPFVDFPLKTVCAFCFAVVVVAVVAVLLLLPCSTSSCLH